MNSKFLLFLGLFFICGSIKVFPQDVSKQLWSSGFLNYIFKNKVRLLSELSYRHVLNQNDDWARYQNMNDFRYSVSNKFDVHAGIFFVYTSHNNTFSVLNSMEYRPFIGVKYHFTQNRRINIRDLIRIEERFINFTEKGISDNFTRLRNRVEIISAINKPTLNEDKVIYFNLDGELFYNISGMPDERFINFFQMRAGPGYRFNYNWRLEIFYILQAAKKDASEIFHSNSHIAAIRLFYFIDRKEIE